ncbi:MAG: hypothetical protein AAGE80_03685 [Pseudomonadota bacterium]
MMMIRCAGTEGASFCRSFFRRETSPSEALGEEIMGLVMSFDALNDYGVTQSDAVEERRLDALAQCGRHG